MRREYCRFRGASRIPTSSFRVAKTIVHSVGTRRHPRSLERYVVSVERLQCSDIRHSFLPQTIGHSRCSGVPATPTCLLPRSSTGPLAYTPFSLRTSRVKLHQLHLRLMARIFSVRRASLGPHTEHFRSRILRNGFAARRHLRLGMEGSWSAYRTYHRRMARIKAALFT